VKKWKVIKSLILKGKLGEALSKANTLVDSDKLSLMSFRYSQMKELFQTGLITLETYIVELNKICDSLLSQVKEAASLHALKKLMCH